MANPARTAVVAELRRGGMSFGDIARRLGMTKNAAVGRFHAALRATETNAVRGLPVQSDPIYAAALIAEGMSVADAAKEAGVSYNVAYQAAKQSREREARELAEWDLPYTPKTAWDHEGASRDA